METTNKTASEILLEAADLLEQEGKWNRRFYFQSDASGGCKMCAHGAISFCGNSEVKAKVLQHFYFREAMDLAIKSGIAIGSSIENYYNEYNELARRENLTPEQWIAKYYKEVGLAHYKAAKVGLTTGYNDNPTTTKQDVINKLREAALST